jgi:hypothetical protein
LEVSFIWNYIPVRPPPSTLISITMKKSLVFISNVCFLLGFSLPTIESFSSPSTLLLSLLSSPQSSCFGALSMARSSSSMEAIPDRQLVYQGMEEFRRGNVRGSIDKFNASVPPGSKAYLWQRGISYYYNNEFALGSQQFRDDVLQSPLDVEEIVWDIACLLRLEGDATTKTFPPPAMLSLPPGKKDRRPIMVRSSSKAKHNARTRTTFQRPWRVISFITF